MPKKRVPWSPITRAALGAMRLEELSQELEYAGADLGDVAENAENILDVLGVGIR